MVRSGYCSRNIVQAVLTKFPVFIMREYVPFCQCQFVPLFEDKIYYDNCLHEMFIASEPELLKKNICSIVGNRKINSSLGYSSKIGH